MVRDLGCQVDHHRLDCSDLEILGDGALAGGDLEIRPQTSIVVIDGGDQLALAAQAQRELHDVARFAGIPTLLVVTLTRLAAVDFSLGFNDFLLAPVVPAELYARIRQLDWRNADFGSDEIVKIGDLLIDVAGHEVYLAGRRLTFPHQEFELLRFLAHNRGRVYSREQLLEQVWHADYQVGTRTVDIHIRRVRAKLGKVVGALIVTVRNVGYKMV